ncbi:FAEL311Wp [Eremothecium gossypii FDAG1]|nr:FAEL311Wp [Eremothecium gossypii FDAG1]
MCGRYALAWNQDQLYDQLKLQHVPVNQSRLEFSPSYNIAPTQMAPVYHGQTLELMNWGVVPRRSHASETNQRYSTFNARSEKLLESQLWAPLCARTRCAVPITGYYEWQSRTSGRQPYFVHRKDKQVLFLAGMYSRAESASGSGTLSYTIVTAPAPRELAWLHDRMPVVLRPESPQWADWLDAGRVQWDAEDLVRVLTPQFDAMLAWHAVTPDVGRVANNSARLMRPLPPRPSVVDMLRASARGAAARPQDKASRKRQGLRRPGRQLPPAGRPAGPLPQKRAPCSDEPLPQRPRRP